MADQNQNMNVMSALAINNTPTYLYWTRTFKNIKTSHSHKAVVPQGPFGNTGSKVAGTNKLPQVLLTIGQILRTIAENTKWLSRNFWAGKVCFYVLCFWKLSLWTRLSTFKEFGGGKGTFLCFQKPCLCGHGVTIRPPSPPKLQMWLCKHGLWVSLLLSSAPSPNFCMGRPRM